MGKQLDENDEYDFEDTTLKIGQVIYILSQKETKVIPAQVCEMINIENLEGTTTTWKVAFGPKENRKTIELDKIPGRKALSLQGALDFIRFEFEQFLELEKKSVEKKVQGWFEQAPKLENKTQEQKQEEDLFDNLDEEEAVQNKPTNTRPQEPTEDDGNKVMLDDGVVGKIVMTDEMKELIQ